MGSTRVKLNQFVSGGLVVYSSWGTLPRIGVVGPEEQLLLFLSRVKSAWNRALKRLRIFAFAVLSLGVGAATTNSAIAQATNDLSSAITELAKKLNEFQGDRAKLTDPIKALDKALDPLRSKDDAAYVDGLIAELSRWLGQQKTTAQKEAAQAKLTPILSALDALDFDKARRLIRELVGVLNTGRFSEKELDDLPKDEQFKPLRDKLAKIAKEPATVRVINATYGDHRTGRICKATAFYRGHCNGKSVCPEDTVMPTGITGALACGYEPAPMAKPGSNMAVVNYSCGSSSATTINLQGKGQIVCP
ncbi:MAG: hypothetical protein QOJ84_4200 [Bradyrhizobium sp.]|jgi:hypothetical protein|nr:hypothetical protein [Bradyrhizobium sp.]